MGIPEQTHHPYMSGQPLPAGGFQELGASNDLNLTLKDMILNDLILKEFGFQLKAKIEVFSKVFACADATWTQDVDLWKTSENIDRSDKNQGSSFYQKFANDAKKVKKSMRGPM